MSKDFTAGARRCAALAARAFGWSPRAFWEATPEELLCALGPAEGAGEPPSRADIERLMERDRDG